MALRRGVREKHADLAVLNAPGGAAVLALDPHRLRSLFEKAGFIDDEHRPWIAHMLQDVGAQVVAHSIRVPLRAGQQPLHAVGPCLARVLGELPAVLALDRAEQAVDIAAHPLALLGAREAWPEPLLDLVPPRSPRGHLRLGEFLPAPMLLHDWTPFGFSRHGATSHH